MFLRKPIIVITFLVMTISMILIYVVGLPVLIDNHALDIFLHSTLYLSFSIIIIVFLLNLFKTKN
jgi:hypothetical protein